ncbi:MAG: glycosyltransferase, partial [Bryobacteraceae bacterium]
CRVIIDTGDAIGFLAKSNGKRSWLGCQLTRLLEWASIRLADALVVRSHFHQTYLAGRHKLVSVVPDGVDIEQFRPEALSERRSELGLSGYLVVGVLGSITWNARIGACYGWELIQALTELRDLPIKGLVIGSGDGLDRLKDFARKAGVSDRVVFVGWKPYDQLPGYLGLADICLSTQSSDLAGQVRTTGKLPLYLASGKHVIATRVGEAARVLPSSMLLSYEGTKDETYPTRLARRLRDLAVSGEWRSSGDESRRLAERLFNYSVLADSVRAVIGNG